MDYTLQIVLLGTTILGIVTGALGSFALLRKQSLLGDAIAHAALPGIAITFLLTHTKSPALLLFGGAVTGGLGTYFMHIIEEQTTLKKNTILGIILSVFFGFGLVLLTIIQKLPVANQSVLNKFLFGNASTLLPSDIYLMSSAGAVVLTILILLWKEFKILSFDPAFAKTIGYPTKTLSMLLTSLMVVAIVIGLQTVGVVLMSSMLIAPAAAARQWTKRLETMVALSCAFGMLSAITGSWLSTTINHLPTGPTIVVVASCIVIVSLLCAPERGVLWRKNVQHRT